MACKRKTTNQPNQKAKPRQSSKRFIGSLFSFGLSEGIQNKKGESTIWKTQRFPYAPRGAQTVMLGVMAVESQIFIKCQAIQVERPRDLNGPNIWTILYPSVEPLAASSAILTTRRRFCVLQPKNTWLFVNLWSHHASLGTVCSSFVRSDYQSHIKRSIFLPLTPPKKFAI